MTPPKILVVDDDASIVRLVRDILSDEGYDARIALNGREALELLDQEEFSLVILDMRMPIVDGWQFAASVRERGRQVPILVMTAARDARNWAEEIQAAGYIAKPFDVDEVIHEVSRIIGPASGEGSVMEIRFTPPPEVRQQMREIARLLSSRAARRPALGF